MPRACHMTPGCYPEIMAVPALRPGQSPRPPRHPADLGQPDLSLIMAGLQDHPPRLQRTPTEFDGPIGFVHPAGILPDGSEMKTGFTQRCRVNPDQSLVAGGGFEPPTSGL